MKMSKGFTVVSVEIIRIETEMLPQFGNHVIAYFLGFMDLISPYQINRTTLPQYASEKLCYLGAVYDALVECLFTLEATDISINIPSVDVVTLVNGKGNQQDQQDQNISPFLDRL